MLHRQRQWWWGWWVGGGKVWMGLTMMTWKGLDANAHENGYYTVKYVCHQHMIINIFVVSNIFIAKYFAGCVSEFSTYCQLVSVNMIKLAHFLCNQFRSDIQKTRLQDIDDYKVGQVQCRGCKRGKINRKGRHHDALILLHFIHSFEIVLLQSRYSFAAIFATVVYLLCVHYSAECTLLMSVPILV